MPLMSVSGPAMQRMASAPGPAKQQPVRKPPAPGPQRSVLSSGRNCRSRPARRSRSFACFLHNGVHAVGNAVAAPAGGTGQQRFVFCRVQVGSNRRPSGGHYIVEKAVSAIRHIGSIKGLQIIPGCGKGAGHIHAAGQAGAGGALQTAACIHQNGVLAARFQGSNVRKADLFAIGQAPADYR